MSFSDRKNNMENQNEVTNQGGQKKTNLAKIILPIVFLAIIALAIGIFAKKPAETPKNTGTAALSWNANTEGDLAGYKIYYGVEKRTGDCPPAGYPQKIDVGKTQTPQNPSHKIENLETGKTYYFSITSYDASGNESCFSDEMSKTIAK